MNRFLTFSTAVFSVAVIFFDQADSAHSQRRRTPQPVEINKVNDHIYEMTGGGISRTAAIVGDNGFMFIDAMQDESSMKETVAKLEQMTGKPLRYIVVTHGDLDHVDGIRHVAPEITVIAHKNILEVMKFQDSGEVSDWSTDPALAALFPDIVFTDQMRIDLGGRIAELYWFGIGHTPSDILVHLPGDRIVFVGDEAGIGGAQIIHAVKGGNSFGHIRVLEKLLDTIDADTYYFGHYPPGGRDVIQTRIDDMKDRHAKVRALIGEGKSRDETVGSFSRGEQCLAGIIFDEITGGSDK